MREFNMEEFNSKRNAEGIIKLTVFLIIMNIIVNVIYFANLEGTYSSLNRIRDINLFTSFGAVAPILFNISNKGNRVSEEERREINRKMILIALLGLPFLAYLIFSIVVVKEIQIIISSLIMLVLFINICIIKDKIFRMKSDLTDTQIKWRKANNNYRGIKESNFLWRIKPMLTPRVSVNIKDRLKNVEWILLIVNFIILIEIGINIENALFLVIMTLIEIKEILYIFDLILGTYSETEGECTGVIRKERSKSRTVYYQIFVTDYDNERELTFNVEGHTYYREGEIIRVIHGGLSKKVINHYTFRKSF